MSNYKRTLYEDWKNGDITIKFKFEDEFKRCLEYIENNSLSG